MASDRKYLFIYCLILFLLFLWNVPLLDPDEPVYGETAKEMLSTGDFLSPRIYGEFWYDKPPLFYWLEAASFSILGISTFSARLPSALIGALTVLYVWYETEKLFSRRTGFLAAAILATFLEFTVLARSAVTDMTLTAALTVALFSFVRRNYVPAYIACGLALLAKGPIGFGFPALIVALWLLAQKKFTLRPIMALRWYWGIPLACLVGLPWYIYMTAVHGQPFIDTFLGYHNLVRFTAPEHVGKDHWWLYLVVLTAGCFPWTGAVCGMLTRLRDFARDPVKLYFIVWAAFIFLFFSASSTQLFSYILPMYPALAVLTALYLEEIFDGRRSRFFTQLHLFFIAITAAALGMAPLTPAGDDFGKYGTVLVLLLLGLLGVRTFQWRHFRTFLLVQGALALCLTVAAWTLFAAPVREAFTSADLSMRVQLTEREDAPLYIDPFYRPASAFYHDLYGLRMPDELTPSEQVPDGSYLLVQKKITDDWSPEEHAQWHIIWETPTASFLRKL